MTFSRLIFSLTMLALSPFAHAHDPFAAEIKGEVTGSTLTFRVTFARSVAAYLAGLSGGPRQYFAAERFQSEKAAFEKSIPSICVLSADGMDFAPTSASVATVEDEEIDVVYTLEFPRPASGRMRLTCPALTKLPELEAYTASFALKEGDPLLIGPGLLTHDDPSVDLIVAPTALSPAKENSATALEHPSVNGWGFFKLGIEHILTGYDHLLYLAALILGCMSLRAIAGIITAFTLAHSITLALATLGWVKPPSALVEQVIAASIVFVALENLWLRGRQPRLRHYLAFAFGLIHGFGFAGLLADLGVGAESGAVVVPLLSFNLGVEAGQLMVIALVLPLLTWARRAPRFVAYGQPAASLSVAAMGLYWLIARF